MEKLDYYNSVTDQVKDLKNLTDLQADKCFSLEKLRQVLPAETAGKIRRVIVTGCGDSYSAAGAMLPGLRELTGLRHCNSPDIVDFCRFYPIEKVTRGNRPEEVLVISISFSGTSGRVIEALAHANDLGAQTVLITRNPQSQGAQTAKYVFDVETPAGCNTPGLRSYYASMVGILALGAYLGVCNGHIAEETFHEIREDIKAYARSFMEEFQRIDDEMFRQAVRMKDYTKFEVIADWNEGYSAQFVEEKFIECGGVFCDHTNSEEFAHISFMYRNPEEIGTMVIVHEDDPSMSRMLDTIFGCLAQHRPTVVVTDSQTQSFRPGALDLERLAPLYQPGTQNGYNSMEQADEAVVCRVAKAPRSWMSPLLDFVPGALLAGYQAAVNEKKYFGGRYDFRTQTWDAN